MTDMETRLDEKAAAAGLENSPDFGEKAGHIRRLMKHPEHEDEIDFVRKPESVFGCEMRSDARRDSGPKSALRDPAKHRRMDVGCDHETFIAD
jgi:hypothetical protein